MNNLLVHRSHPRPKTGLTITSPAIIDDKEQTPMCGPWRWRIPKLRLAPAVRSLYFRLRGRTPLTILKQHTDNDTDVSDGQKLPARKSNRVEPVTQTAFSTSSSSKCLQPSTIDKGSPIASSSSVNERRNVSTPSRLTLPGAVGESEVFATVQSDGSCFKAVATSNCQTSEEGQPKTIAFCRPKYIAGSDSDHSTYQQEGNGLDSGESPPTTASETKESIPDDGWTPSMDQFNDSDISTIHGEGVDRLSKGEVSQPVNILVITHSPSPTLSGDTGSDVEINMKENEKDLSVDEVKEPRPFSRIGKECWEEQESGTTSPVEGFLTGEESVCIRSSVDSRKPDDADREGNLWVKDEETTVEIDSELEEELNYYEDNDQEGDDDLDMDKVLRKCPPTEVLQNLRDMIQLSKNTTSQLEKTLRRAARISCGPFPRLPGSGLTKSEVIEVKCAKLVGETEGFLGDMNRNFLTFYTVLEQMDKVGAQQDIFASSTLVKRGPRDWRRGHAAILRKMEKLWSRDYPKIITRKVQGNIPETISEMDE